MVGEGGFGKVRKIIDRRSGVVRAMKVINIKDLKKDIRCSKVFQEIKLQNEMDHPNILKVFEYFNDEK